MPTYPDYRPMPTGYGRSLRDLSPGSQVADIILEGGQRRAQLLMEAGRQKAAAFEGIGSDLAGAATAAFNARNDAKVQGAVRSAAAPGADINAILGGLPPELQGRAMKGISDWNEYTTKRQESELKIKDLQGKIAAAQKEQQQHDADKLAVGAHHVEGLFDTAQGAVAGINMLYSGAKGDKLTDDRFDDFVSSVNDGWQAAQGDPAREATFLAALKQQAGPVLQSLKQAGSASVQEKFKPETETITTKNPDGSTRTEIVEKKPGVVRTGFTPDTRSVDEQIAAAHLVGDEAKVAKLTEAKRMSAAAGRDPAAAEARADARNDTRMDRSFQFNSAELERTSKPLTDQAERFGRLVETVNQRTPQADALIAPELLTVMAGGSGSGLRMNEAEISRVIGGRSNIEGLKAALNKWSIDPSKALSVTDEQRKQIQALIGAMRDKIVAKTALIDDARNALIDAKTPDEQRRAMATFKKRITEVGTSEGGGGARKNPFR